MISRANNHTLDWGLQVCARDPGADENGIIHAGAGENLAQAGAARFLDWSWPPGIGVICYIVQPHGSRVRSCWRGARQTRTQCSSFGQKHRGPAGEAGKPEAGPCSVAKLQSRRTGSKLRIPTKPAIDSDLKSSIT
ncbi:CapA family protein [Mesorhizobium sp. M1307]|uniref:hypothetical protein n=1 Tax=Mesorhizobium sp. M1307 TaxID=2957079 RepID=UPI003334F2F2